MVGKKISTIPHHLQRLSESLKVVFVRSGRKTKIVLPLIKLSHIADIEWSLKIVLGGTTVGYERNCSLEYCPGGRKFEMESWRQDD